MSSSHYSPNTSTIVVNDIKQAIKQHHSKRLGVISLKQHDLESSHIAGNIVLSYSGNLEEVAQNLYAAMHHLDELALDLILIELAPEEGIGKAINDRLARSSFQGKE